MIYSDSDEVILTRRSSKEAMRISAMKGQLKQLLSQPLVAIGTYKSYLTSGSRDIIEDLLKSDGAWIIFYI